MLTVLATLDGVLLIALVYGILSAKSEFVLLVAPTYSVLFMVLACSLDSLPERGLVSRQLVSGILLVGPLGAAADLCLCRPASSG